MQPRINIITLGTHDLAAAIHFYEDGLSFPRMSFEGDVAFFNLNGSCLAVYPWELLAKDATVAKEGTGFRGITLAHNVNSEAEVNVVLEQAKAAGANIVKPAQATDWGGFSGYFSDLDGHLWEVAFNPIFWPGPPDIGISN
ncbi:VOC family protein [Candidatus Odyssella acanthamoebae]|uniref:Glyoxalase n=1 Tax=Candidatus Odyssella acanthamoebae TaxID=91604 RepID=A0A077AUM5_9PROT|nr:VOC family protein [Candidatus Paracaedibacter acanthamoebae]AIK96882.1 glyoxalase [Candidatus Paracaedibacter acanthamoebae]